MSIIEAASKERPFKRRPVVAYFNGNIHDLHSRDLIQELYEGFQGVDIDLHYYMGADLNDYLESNVISTLRVADHYYALFSYSAYDPPDIIIISMGGLTNADNSTSVEEFISHFPPVPILLLENDTVLPNVYHILIDNYGGMYDMVEHLIKEHGLKRIAHLAGPVRNNDSHLRMRAYQDAMRDNNIPEGPILHGDYSRNVDEQVEALLDFEPDAIVSANDVMAGKIYQLMEKRGKEPGRDIAVTGFDDNPTAAFMEPPLTTVRQDNAAVAAEAVRQTVNYFQGSPLKDVILPAQLVCRNSCGCSNEVSAKELTGKHLLEHHEQIGQMILQSMESAVTLRNMLFQELDVKEIFNVVGNTLMRLKTARSFILLHERPILRNKREVVDAPDEILMVLSQEGSTIHSYNLEEAPRIHRGELRKYLKTDESTYLTDYVLFYQKYEYGVMIVEIPPEDLLFFYSLSLEIGSGLRYLQISMDRQTVRHSLEEKNQILEYVASHDNLTGLYNRAGIMSEIFAYVRKYPLKERFLLVMADLDHLKQINDSFGHSEGDDALRRASIILQSAFPEGSPVGRNGGDEFIGVMHLEKEGQTEEFLNTLREECRLFDETDEKPYFLGISAGVQEFGSEDLGDILQVIEKADQMLYEAKAVRRPYVLRTNV